MFSELHFDLLLSPIQHLDPIKARLEHIVVRLHRERDDVLLREHDGDRNGVVQARAHVQIAHAELIAVDVYERFENAP